MILRLVSGSLTPARIAEELRAGLHALDVQAHVLVRLEHVLEFVLAQQARIHEDAVEVLADGPCAAARRPPTSRRRPKVRARPCRRPVSPQLAHGGLYETLRGPLLPAAADTHDEILQQVRAVGRMVNLGVELDAPGLLTLDCGTQPRAPPPCWPRPCSRRHGRDRIAVRHPHLRGRRQAAHQRSSRHRQP